MAYLGRKSGNAALTSADIPDNSITSAKIVAGTVAASDVAADVATQAELDAIPVFDDTDLRQDILTLALREGVNENSTKFNLPNSSIVQFAVDADFNLAGSTNVSRSGEATGSNINTITFGTPAYNTSDRESELTVTSSRSWQYDIGHLFEGSGGTGSVTTSTYPSGDVANDAVVVKVDFGASFAKPISGYRFYADGSNNGQTVVGKVQGSNDNSNWTDLKTGISSFFTVVGDGNQTESWTNTTIYRYIQFIKTSGTISNTGYWNEIEFLEADKTISATGTAYGTTNVPLSAVTKVAGVMLIKDSGSGTSTLGTDLKISFTADNSAWTETASYTDVGTFSFGIKMIKLGETTCTSGSDVRWKVEWANQGAVKETAIHGIGLNY